MLQFSNFHDTSTLNNRAQGQHAVQLFVPMGLASFCLTAIHANTTLQCSDATMINPVN